MRLHSTAAVVRTWERGHERVPDDALPGLAELLALDEAQLRALQRPAPSDEAADTPSKEPVPEMADVRPEPDPPTAAPSAKTRPPETSDAETTDAAASADEPPEPDPSPNGSSDAKEVVGHTPGLAVDTGLLEAPTEAIEPIRPAATGAGVAAATGTRLHPATKPASVPRPSIVAEAPTVEPAAVLVDGSVPDWLGPLRVLFDPTKRYLYWARWVGTAIGLYILLRLLGFAVDGLLEAIGDFWESFSTPEPAGIGDETAVDALAALLSV